QLLSIHRVFAIEQQIAHTGIDGLHITRKESPGRTAVERSHINTVVLAPVVHRTVQKVIAVREELRPVPYPFAFSTFPNRFGLAALRPDPHQGSIVSEKDHTV